MTLDETACGQGVTVAALTGERAFRRRLMELGLVPGTEIELLRVAPMGDPLELRARGSRLSIRRAEARGIAVKADPAPAAQPSRPPPTSTARPLPHSAALSGVVDV